MNESFSRMPLFHRRIPNSRVNISNSGKIVAFFLLHVFFALLFFVSPVFATVHALFTFLIGLIWALNERHIHRAPYIVAYIVGSEVLWRMTDADIFWEFAKYALIIIFMVAFFRQRRGRKVRLVTPFFYFALLLPSLIYTVYELPFDTARQEIALAISGPCALMTAVWFFANIKLTAYQLQIVFLAVASPVLGVATLAVRGALTAEDLYFTDQSNKLLSGGFGPNQVASILSFAVVALFFYLLESQSKLRLKLFLFTIMGILAVVSIFTFSRGGPYMIIASLVVAFPFLLGDASPARRRFLLVSSLLLVIAIVLLPFLNRFTDGVLFKRFQDTDLTGRNLIIQGDFLAWYENPIAGTGPGLAGPYRQMFFHSPRAHTEFTRMLAEHGILGLFSILLFGKMAWNSFFLAKDRRAKAFVIAMICWCILYMLINAMRLSVPSFVFGLSTMVLSSQTEKANPSEKVMPILKRSRLHRQKHI